jgi:hypothetical protein
MHGHINIRKKGHNVYKCAVSLLLPCKEFKLCIVVDTIICSTLHLNCLPCRMLLTLQNIYLCFVTVMRWVLTKEHSHVPAQPWWLWISHLTDTPLHQAAPLWRLRWGTIATQKCKVSTSEGPCITVKKAWYIYVHSFSSLSYDRSEASSKVSSPHSVI